MTAVVGDAALDFVDGLIDEIDGALAVAAFVGGGAVQVRPCLAEIRQCCLHLRLGGAELAGDESDCENENE